MVYSLYKLNNETIHIRKEGLIYRHKNHSITGILDYENENITTFKILGNYIISFFRGLHFISVCTMTTFYF